MRILPALSSPKGLLLLIIILAGFLRLWDLPSTPPGLYPDESMNGNNALEALETAPPAGGWKVFYPENNGREGLFINIQSLSLAAFGNEPWALRLPSAIFGILTVLGVYFLTRELFRESKDKTAIALLAAFLLATSFWHINFSRIGFRAIMAPAFLTWGIYLLLFYLNKIQKSKLIQSASWRTKIRNLLILPALAGLIYGLGMHSYIAFRATPLLILFIIAAYWLKNKDSLVRKKILLASFFFILASIIVFLPLGLYFFQNLDSFFGRTTQVSVFASETPLQDLATNTIKTLGMFNFVGDYNWRHNYSGAPQLFWPVGIMFIIGLILGARSLIKKSKIKNQNDNSKFKTFQFPFFILISWIIVAAMPVVISNEGIPHALRAIIMIPPVFILSAVGGVRSYYFLASKISSNSHGRESLRRLLKTGSVTLLLFILLNSYFTYFVRWAKNPNTAAAFAKNYVEVGRQLNSLPPEVSKYVIVNAGGVDVRGLPMPSQTVMFITDTFTPEKQAQKNIHYLLPSEVDKIKIPESAFVVPLN